MTIRRLTQSFRPEVARALPWLLAQRFIGNVGIRFAYTFLPAIARGTGLSIESVSRILGGRDLMALVSPGIGRAADRSGTGRVLTVASAVTAAGLLLSVLGPTGFLVGALVFGVGKIGFDVTMNAWIADEVAYERRGKVSGLIELSWAGAALIGLPICGLLITQFGWRAPFLVLGLLSLPLAFGLNRADADGHAESGPRKRPRITGQVLLALGAVFGLTASSQLLMVGHGLWLEDGYGFDAAEVGFAIVSVGIIEAIASLASSSVADRLGKRWSMAAGSSLLLFCTIGLALEPVPSLPIGLGLLAGAFLGFEFAFVSSLPLISELDPEARAEMIGITLGASTVVRAIGSVVGAWLYVRHGFGTLMTVSAGAAAIAFVLAATAVREPVPTDRSEMMLQ